MPAFHLNGKPCNVDADDAVPLLAVLPPPLKKISRQ